MTQVTHVEHHDTVAVEAVEPPLSITRLLRTLGAYRAVIALSLLAVAVGYTIFALALYLLAPSQRVTTLRFRLDFPGAELGQYPTGVKFSSADIISSPILTYVYQQNDLKRFTKLGDFTRAIVVLESNPAYEALAADYNARLSDRTLTQIDRERIQREWDAKRASLNKNEFAISFARYQSVGAVPEDVARKVLVDILRRWAQVAINEQHVLDYPVALVSPSLFTPSPLEQQNAIAGTQVLRTRIRNVMENVEKLQELPGSELVRSQRTHSSLQEIHLRLEDLIRFRLDPLIRQVASAPMANRDAAADFVEAQLQYDQQRYAALNTAQEDVRNALAMYSNQEQVSSEVAAATTSTASPERRETSQTSAVLNDSFIDRLVELTARSNDLDYREKLVNDYRELSQNAIPAQQAVTYDEQVLTALRKPAGGTPLDPAVVQREIDAVRAETRAIIAEITEIHSILSRNRNPSTQLYTTTAVPTAKVLRTGDPVRVLLFGILALLVALPIVIASVLIHHRFVVETT